jgi:hypothetical protein
LIIFGCGSGTAKTLIDFSSTRPASAGALKVARSSEPPFWFIR